MPFSVPLPASYWDLSNGERREGTAFPREAVHLLQGHRAGVQGIQQLAGHRARRGLHNEVKRA